MASTIILSDNGASSGSAGLKQTAGNDGVLILQTTTSGGTATNAVYVDTSQNVGLGVTPSAWASPYKAAQVGVAGGLASWGNSSSVFSNNTYNNSGWKYINSSQASMYSQESGGHYWWSAASGTAGNAITFTQAMTLDASGNLAIGATSASARVYIKQSDGTASSGFKVVRYNNDNQYLSLWATGGSRYIDAVGDSSVSSETVFRRSIDSGSNFTESARIDSSGNLLVNMTSGNGNGKFRVIADGSSQDIVSIKTSYASTGSKYISFANSSGTEAGNINQNGTTTVQYATSSDYRLKENVQPMTGALEKVAQLKPVTYTWKSDGTDGQGFIAHELQEVVPDCVHGEKDAVDEDGNPKYQGIDTSFLVATLTAAIQELKAELDTAKEQIAILQGAQQ